MNLKVCPWPWRHSQLWRTGEGGRIVGGDSESCQVSGNMLQTRIIVPVSPTAGVCVRLFDVFLPVFNVFIFLSFLYNTYRGRDKTIFRWLWYTYMTYFPQCTRFSFGGFDQQLCRGDRVLQDAGCSICPRIPQCQKHAPEELLHDCAPTGQLQVI